MRAHLQPVYVEAVGLVGPGLPGWDASQPVLRGEAAYVEAAMGPHESALLPANERRRMTPAVRLAFAAAEDAMKRSALKPAELASVFATSEADTGVLHQLCTGLATEPRVISPTSFHNSVHNAAAGYWSIATACRQPSSSISAFDATFAAGLLEAATLAQADAPAALLVSYDVRPPEFLRPARPLVESFGVALMLTQQPGPHSMARLDIAPAAGAETALDDAGLERLRAGNPAARALPLLQLLARRVAGCARLAGVGTQHFAVTVAPC